VTELLFIRSYRGGNNTQAMYKEVFPFNQYTVINIEVKTTFLYGSSYNVSTTAYMSDSYNVDGILRLIGDKDSLIKLEENSFAVKKLNPNNGVLQINFSGTASINHVSTKIIVDVSTNPSNGPIDIPFDGTWLFTLEKNAKVTVNSHIAFLPGSGLVMEEGSEMIISKDGRVTILNDNDNMVWNSGDTYPTSTAVFYRTNPTFSFNKTSNINLDLNGKIIVESGGGISGKIESELFLEYGSVVNYDYKYVKEFTGTFIKSANYSTFPVSLKATHLDIDKFNNNVTIYRALNENNEDSLYLTETLLDWNNNPLVNAEVEIYHEEIGSMIKTTDENGKVVFEVPFNNNWEFKEKVTYKFTVNYENVTYSYPYVFENVPLIVDVSKNEFNDLENSASEIDFDITIIETFTGNPLVNHEINLEIKDSPTWLKISNDGPIKTDLEGKVKITISIFANGQGKNARSAVVNININYDGFDEILKVNISQKAGESSGSSPYIYSTDKDGNLNLENGPISLSVLKTIESSSYGTLKLLESIDGKYYIQVIEDGTSTTMFNSANLYAVDYLDDGFVLGVLYDIYGEPHTIKEKILPNSFVDENGTSYLDEISQMDEVFATLPYSANQLSHFYLTFDKNTLYNNAKFVISIRNNGSLLSTLESMGNINIDGFSDLWLLDALLMSDPNNIEIVNNIVKAFEIKVQVWNGFAWVTQGTLQPSSKLTEEFLIPIDLTGISNEIKIRIEMPTQSGYGIDSVYMDFSENMPMIKRELTPISALTQDGIDVLDIITISNDEYVKLLAYEYVMLEYETPELLEGYSRGYGFKMEGYAYKGLDLKTEDDILEQFIGLDFNQILDVVYNSEREDLLEHIEMIAEFAQTLIYMGTLEEEELIELFLYLGNSN